MPNNTVPVFKQDCLCQGIALCTEAAHAELLCLAPFLEPFLVEITEHDLELLEMTSIMMLQGFPARDVP